MSFASSLTLVRGGGDLATGVIYRLHQAGFPVIVLELAQPLVVRRRVAVATAVREGEVAIEGMMAQRVGTTAEAINKAQAGLIPVLVAPDLPAFPRPISILIDARMAKRNIDTRRDQATLVIALGPGFDAGSDCHAVIETMRGHRLGRVIWQGSALPNTGTPGIVAGKGAERVVRAPAAGAVVWLVEIGDRVAAAQPLGSVGGQPIFAPFDGVVRGLIAPGTHVNAGLKIGDIDARGDVDACFTISDKALAIGGGVLEAILHARQQGQWELPTLPRLSLPAALGMDTTAEIVAFTGGGGKTSLLFALGAALPPGVILGATTRLAQAELAQAPAVCRLTELDQLGTALRRFGRCLLVGTETGEKVMGMPPDLPGQLLRRPNVRHVLIEADGSRQRPCKAPAVHEPVIPPEATLVVPVVGISAIGQPIAAVAHRPEQVCALTGLAPDAPLTPAALAALLIHAEGGLKGVPETARAVAFINQVEAETELQAARQIARLALRQLRLSHVVIGAARTPQPVREIHKRVRAIVLAAGESRRMGQTKQLLPWGETTVLGQTLQNVAQSSVFDTVVVTGHEAAAVGALAAAAGAATIHNPDYATGEMLSSLQTAVREIEAHIAAVLVALADQPMVPAAVLDALLAAYWQGRGDLIAPAYQGQRGNPVLIGRPYFAALLGLPPGAAPRDLLRQHAAELYLVHVDTDAILRDLDYPAEYEQQRAAKITNG
ncbi:MAG: hypothetical protein Fur0021_19170 [Candidatus Promineifilaceae bacterium]